MLSKEGATIFGDERGEGRQGEKEGGKEGESAFEKSNFRLIRVRPTHHHFLLFNRVSGHIRIKAKPST